MKKVKYTNHAKLKFKILKSHGFIIDHKQVDETLLNPDKVIQQSRGRLIAQKRITDIHVLRVVYREENNTIIVITFYPGRKERYEN
ncbi:MAG: DUF4258 domain-containing protein [Candidatus Marinimicrobia bacterium]|nr:DUF4258 domain-containing protein [Candidatus Neomarinimicrobiota bacterium]